MKQFGVKYWVYFLLFFFVFYFENGIKFGGLSLAAVWKMPILVYLFFFMVKNTRKKIPLFIKVNTLYSFKQFFNPYLLANLGIAIDSFSRYIVQSLFFVYFKYKYKGREIQLERMLYVLSQFVVLASLPVLLGILEPFVEKIDTSRYGIEGLEYFSGIFGTYHTASAYYSMTTVFFVYRLVNKIGKNGENKWDLLFLLLSSYMLFLTYVRTGWIMALLGILFVVKPKTMTFSKKIKYAIILCFLFLGIFVFYANNELFRARITNRDVYASTEQKVDISGSGRTQYWSNGVALWGNSDFDELLFGCGIDKVLDNNYKTTGMKIISHSEFVDALAQQGLIAFVLLLLFYFYLYKYIARRKHSKYYNLSFSMLIMLFLFSFFQGRVPFLAQILSTIVFVLLDFDSKSIIKYNDENINCSAIV